MKNREPIRLEASQATASETEFGTIILEQDGNAVEITPEELKAVLERFSR